MERKGDMNGERKGDVAWNGTVKWKKAGTSRPVRRGGSQATVTQSAKRQPRQTGRGESTQNGWKSHRCENGVNVT